MKKGYATTRIFLFQAWKSSDAKFNYRAVEKDENGRLGVQEKKDRLPAEFIDHFQRQISGFPLHRFLAKNQKTEFNFLLKNLKPGYLVLVSDYAEKHTIRENEEIQSLHWHNNQVTIFNVVAHFVKYDHETGDYKKMKLYFAFLTKRPEQDNYFVAHCHQRVLQWLKETFNIVFKCVHCRSDRCRAQFCQRKVFGSIAESRRRFCVDHEGNKEVGKCCPRFVLDFSASGHGKNEVDHVGALAKTRLREEEQRGNPPRTMDAIDACLGAMNFVDPSRTKPGKQDNRGYFYSGFHSEVVQPESVDVPNVDWKTVEKTQLLHLLATTATPGELIIRESSCFSCEACQQNDFLRCLRTAELGPVVVTKVHRIVTTTATARAATRTRAGQENHRNEIAELALIDSVIAKRQDKEDALEFVLVTKALGGNENPDQLEGMILKNIGASRNVFTSKGSEPTSFFPAVVRSPPLCVKVIGDTYEIDIDEIDSLVTDYLF